MSTALPKTAERVVEVLTDLSPVYLVGGAVRDLLLGLHGHDLDFVLPGDVFGAARRVANQLGGAFYILDSERSAARVILDLPDEPLLTLDFSAQRGPNLLSDLRARDFTINAMALDIQHPDVLIDPLSGAQDLREKKLRACSPTSLSSDPLRVLRAVRLATVFDLHILPETFELIQAAAPLLPQVSPERIRDELFNLLGGPQPAVSLRLLSYTGAIPVLFPELAALQDVEQSLPHLRDVWNHTLSVLKRLSALLEVLGTHYQPEDASNLFLGLAVLQLGKFREQIVQHLNTPIAANRPFRPLLFMAALYHDIGKPETHQVDEAGNEHFYHHDQLGEELVTERAEALHLSNVEIERLRRIVRHHMRPGLLANAEKLPSRRAIYRFFRDTGPAGVDICLLSLADVLATYEHTLPVELWNRQLEVVRTLLEAWWEHQQEQVAPSPVVNGNDLIAELNLQPGPIIGQLLAAIRESQAAGEISTSSEALALARKIVNSSKL